MVVGDFSLNYVSIGLPPLIAGAVGLLFAVLHTFLVWRAPMTIPEVDDESKIQAATQKKIAEAIRVGAKAFIYQEYRALLIAVVLLFILIAVAVAWQTAICYLVGALTSASCGYIGMMVATMGNVRTATAAQISLDAALRVAFNAGSVLGIVVVSLGIMNISALLMIFDDQSIGGKGALAGFGMGASTVSIFARVAGGIFTKAADVGADLVGKVEANFPEDDVRNPATIADNVGDNVGDVAGMGADLFSSLIGSIIASSLLGFPKYGYAGIALPYWIAMSGLLASLIGMLLVRTKEGADQHSLLNVLRRAMGFAAVLQVGFMAIIVWVLFERDAEGWKLFGCLVIGLFAGSITSTWSEYFTSSAYPPTRGIMDSSAFGAGNVVIEGIAVGGMATVGPVMFVAAVVIAVVKLSGSYGIALASTGMLSTLAITLATDAYGPVADNAGGIAEMSHLKPEVRERTDILDALGNTTAAVGKGFAVGSAVLTALSLLNTFILRVNLKINGLNEMFYAGALIGAMLPYCFMSMTMMSVSKAAGAVVVEVRRQLKTIPGLLEGAPGVNADHARCVTMITTAALYSAVLPALLVVCSPLILGIGLGTNMLCGMVLGVIISGCVLGCMMNTAGGAWDNAKKLSEVLGYKKPLQDRHSACVIGDCVGDPFKDTSGPALNIQIKLTSYLCVVLSPIFKNQADYWWVSLIIIGILMIFVPFWVVYCAPPGIRKQDRDDIIGQMAITVKNSDIPLSKIQNEAHPESEPLIAADTVIAALESADAKGVGK